MPEIIVVRSRNLLEGWYVKTTRERNMDIDDDSVIGQFIQRWVFIARLALILVIVGFVLRTIQQCPLFVIRWYNTDEQKESRYLGLRVISQLCGIYASALFVGVFSDFVALYWPTLSSLYMDNSGFGETLHLLSVLSDSLGFALAAWGISNYTEKLGFIEYDPQSETDIFYSYQY